MADATNMIARQVLGERFLRHVPERFLDDVLQIASIPCAEVGGAARAASRWLRRERRLEAAHELSDVDRLDPRRLRAVW